MLPESNKMINVKHIRSINLIFIILSLLVLGSVSFAQDYIVGDGDVLRINVYNHPDLDITTRVSAHGVIIFPLLGEVELDGLTVSQISEKILKLLSDGYIINPQVTVFIEEFRSKKTFIMGQINKPGSYELRGDITLLELISLSGGITKDAGEHAIIKRTSGAAENLVVDLKNLIQHGDHSLNLSILDGDSVYITKAGLFYVTGQVNKPAAYTYEEGTTIIKAISLAGGFSLIAAKNKINIIRTVEGEKQVLQKVKMDEPLFPDDVVVVPESFF